MKLKKHKYTLHISVDSIMPSEERIELLLDIYMCTALYVVMCVYVMYVRSFSVFCMQVFAIRVLAFAGDLKGAEYSIGISLPAGKY